MRKTDIVIVAILFALLLAWRPLYYRFFPPPPAPAPRAIAATNTPPRGVSAGAASPGSAPASAVEAARTNAAPPAIVQAHGPQIEAPAHAAAEQVVVVSNAVMRLSVSSWGGGVRSAVMLRYRATLDRDSGPLHLDFGGGLALAFMGLAGATTNADMALSVDGRTVSATRPLGPGLAFRRTLTLGDGYELRVTDEISNSGAQAAVLPDHGVRLGRMRVENPQDPQSATYLGIDTLASEGGERVRHWYKDLPRRFKDQAREKPQAPARLLESRIGRHVEWVAVKNKFFVQILCADGGCDDAMLIAERTGEGRRGGELSAVGAAAWFAAAEVAPGETLTREMRYYAGPKDYAILRGLGLQRDDVMELGWFKPVCKALIVILKAIYDVWPNYGVAVILLTVLVRILFWPLTHKSSVSMKKMQELQPKMMELREKYKDKPQKLQQETMALYKAHKVNPMAGCLPILVQIPVFIALYNMLRSAVELRYAPFLWISDLSEPENILAGVLPIPLNILPLLMTATMVWQQKLTPTTGDPRQQKMMAIMMPVMMLFFFYKIASALVLYWTVSQCLMIAQLLLQRYRSTHRHAPDAGRAARK